MVSLGSKELTLCTLQVYSARMSPENTHKLMGGYMEVLILGVILQYIISVAVPHRVYS